jgi:hypothetical protein
MVATCGQCWQHHLISTSQLTPAPLNVQIDKEENDYVHHLKKRANSPTVSLNTLGGANVLAYARRNGNGNKSNNSSLMGSGAQVCKSSYLKGNPLSHTAPFISPASFMHVTGQSSQLVGSGWKHACTGCCSLV